MSAEQTASKSATGVPGLDDGSYQAASRADAYFLLVGLASGVELILQRFDIFGRPEQRADHHEKQG